MSICSSEAVNESAFSYYPQLEELQKFCQENFQKEITLLCAADICGFERTYFCTYFHLKVGVCFKCWLGLLRVTHAKQLIKTNNQAITCIAYDTGFNSLSNFERTFKRSTGMTPIAYKQLMKPC
jgi:AraC-like DNA-binding protein